MGLELKTSGGFCFGLFLGLLLKTRQARLIPWRQLARARGFCGRRRPGVANFRDYDLFFFFFFLGQGNLYSTVQGFGGKKSGVVNKGESTDRPYWLFQT